MKTVDVEASIVEGSFAIVVLVKGGSWTGAAVIIAIAVGI